MGAIKFAALMTVLYVVIAVPAQSTVWISARYLKAPQLRHLRMALRVGRGWRRLTRNLDLARTEIEPKSGEKTVRYPKARLSVDRYGVVVDVRTLPRVGKAEFDKAMPYIRDAWKCRRVRITQPKPGRLLIRGLRHEPLAEPLELADIPQIIEAPEPFRPYLGRDEWGVDRVLELAGITGITVCGLPGRGKTSLIVSLLIQMFGSASVQFVFMDGKGGHDYSDLRSRAWLNCGDDLEEAEKISGLLHEEMRVRQDQVVKLTGHKNAWKSGPTPEFPLIVVVWDECHTYFDLDAHKGDRPTEALVRKIRTNAGQLVKKGRSVLILNVFLTQKQTSDAIPTAIRDNCAVGLAFAVKTRDAAIAGLGEAIREHPSYCPTGLRDPEFVGVCTVSGLGGQPFTRLRIPNVPEEAAAAGAERTAHLMRDPSLTIAVPELVLSDAEAA